MYEIKAMKTGVIVGVPYITFWLDFQLVISKKCVSMPLSYIPRNYFKQALVSMFSRDCFLDIIWLGDSKATKLMVISESAIYMIFVLLSTLYEM